MTMNGKEKTVIQITQKGGHVKRELLFILISVEKKESDLCFYFDRRKSQSWRKES
jgi:hypothetical protein